MTTLPPLRVTVRVRCPSLEAQRVDVRTDRFGDPTTIQREERDQRVITRGRETSGDEQRTEFVAVKTRRVRFLVEARTANMRRGGMLDEVFFFGIPVERRDGAEPPRDR